MFFGSIDPSILFYVKPSNFFVYINFAVSLTVSNIARVSTTNGIDTAKETIENFNSDCSQKLRDKLKPTELNWRIVERLFLCSGCICGTVPSSLNPTSIWTFLHNVNLSLLLVYFVFFGLLTLIFRVSCYIFVCFTERLPFVRFAIATAASAVLCF